MAESMTHLLDTNVIINHIHLNIPPPFPDHASLAISVITLGELLYGIKRSSSHKKMISWLDSFMSEHSISIQPITQAIIETFVDIKIELEKRGEKLADFDLLIAATAIEHNLTLVTANTKHFSRIRGLALA